MAEDFQKQYAIHISGEAVAATQVATDKKRKVGTLENLVAQLNSVKMEDKVVFYRLLATMINAGLTITKSMRILAVQAENPKMKLIIEQLGDVVEEGKTLSDGLRLYPKVFEESVVGMVEAGEASGKLNSVLLDIATQSEKTASISRKIKGAMIYPAAIILVIIGVVIVVMVMVVPPLKELFGGLGSDLPYMTQLLIAGSDFFVADTFGIPNFVLVVFALFAFFMLVNTLKQTPRGRFVWDYLMLHVPVFGKLNAKVALSRFSRFLGNLIKSGIPIVKSLQIDANAVGNEVYKRRVLLIADDVKRGITIADNIKDDKLFPPMMVSMISVGEQTAQIDGVVNKIADFYDEEVDAVISNISKLMEPFILVILAVLVGVIAMAIMSPIMSLMDTFSAA